MERRRWVEARDLLDKLDQKNPRRQEVLFGLLDCCFHLKDYPRYQSACEQLLVVKPNDPDLLLNLAGTYMANARIALALLTFRRFVNCWPTHPRAKDARREMGVLEQHLNKICSDLGLSGTEGLQLAARHEEMLSLLEQGKYEQVCRVGEELLRHRSDFAPAFNNMSEAFFRLGRLDRAVATTRRLLEVEPNNFHALANLTRFLYLSGNHAEAQENAQKLREIVPSGSDAWTKKAETLSCLGDDQGVLDALRGAEQDVRVPSAPVTALLYHLAAASAYRLGKEDEARRYWCNVIKKEPGFSLARDNLKDLDQPVGKRHAPWAFDFNNWISDTTVREWMKRLEPVASKKSDEAVTRNARRFLQDHPEIAGLVPVLLERGDPMGREFAMRIAQFAETPAMLAALRDFAFSKNGPDDLRAQAAQAVEHAGLVPSGEARLWLEGEWREMLLMSFELTSEPTRTHSPAVEKLAVEAMQALRSNDGLRAEQQLRQALALSPDAPDLLNNLAMAYRIMGRDKEGDALVREIHEKHPDYFFGRVNMCHMLVLEGKREEAREMLRPLLTRRRLHTTEYSSLCIAEIDLFLADGKPEAARSWFQMWEQADPDNPQLAQWRQRLRIAGLWNKFTNWLPSFTRK